jgi:hypothetical protein
MEERIVLNHCRPFGGRVEWNYKFEIRAEDKVYNMQDVGRDLMGMWLDERIDPGSLPDNLVAFYLRYNGESLNTYLVYPEPKACDFAATLVVERNSPAHMALKGAYVIDESYYG